jgi:putative transposase
MEKAYSFRFYPTPDQESLLRCTLGCVRLVYNKALHERTQAWYERQERVSYKETSSMLTEWKKQEDLVFLNDVSCVPLQQGLRHLQTAFSNFFSGRTKYPNFKKKHQGGSAEFTKSAFKFKDGQIYLAKCQKPLNIKWSRQIPQGSEPSTVTVRLHPSGRWHISIRFDDPRELSLPTTNKAVGIDLGISSLLITSDGNKITNPRHLKRNYRQLRLAQKALSRKQKGSKNREKARVKVARIHQKITDTRKDHLHKLTTQLVSENQTIVVEDLAVNNMVKNHKLAQAISDASWGELTRQLEYKCKWYGRNYIEIDRWFPSSKRCSNCGYIVEKMPLSIREWDCSECGTPHDRDLNAAQNILAAGLAVSVCGATIRPEQGKSVKAGALKQKPNS